MPNYPTTPETNIDPTEAIRVAHLLREVTREMVLAASASGRDSELDERLITEAMRTGAAVALSAELASTGRLDRRVPTVEWWVRYACRLIDRVASECRRLFRLPLPLGIAAALAAATATSRAVFAACGGW